MLPLGVSQSGLPIEALAFTRRAGRGAVGGGTGGVGRIGAACRTRHRQRRRRDRPAVVVIAGQHGDEPAGSEALIVIAQDLAAGRLDRVLDQVDVYLLPRANPDGAVLGQRASADGSDINRDHLLLRTPEAQAMAQLVRDVAPVVVLDLHEYAVDAGFAAKFGGVQRYRRAARHGDRRQPAPLRGACRRGMVSRAAGGEPGFGFASAASGTTRWLPTRPIAWSRWAASARRSAATPMA